MERICSDMAPAASLSLPPPRPSHPGNGEVLAPSRSQFVPDSSRWSILVILSGRELSGEAAGGHKQITVLEEVLAALQ